MRLSGVVRRLRPNSFVPEKCFPPGKGVVMLKLIVGVKGTGKTKALINAVNSAYEASSGAVVCLEQGEKLRYDIRHQVRLINTLDYMKMCIRDSSYPKPQWYRQTFPKLRLF